MKPYLIGISGASCSGKTTLAHAIAGALKERESVIISLDSYYHDLSHLTFENRKKQNFDIPGAVDFELLLRDISSLIKGKEIIVPRYLFSSHIRAPLSEGHPVTLDAGVVKKPVVILEGLHTFYPEDLRAMIDLKIFIELPLSLCLNRRINRDTKERGRTANDVRRQFQETVVPMYEKYITPIKEYSDLIVDGDGDLKTVAEKVLDIIRRDEYQD
jgi:uridine kinase